MKKTELQELLKKADESGTSYVAVKIETEGGNRPEIIINPRENIKEKLHYYMNAYDDDLVLNSTKGKKYIRIVGAAQGKTFEEIQWQLMQQDKPNCKKLLADAIDRTVKKMLAEIPPNNEEERIQCEAVFEGIKGMFIDNSYSSAEEKFICENIDQYERLFDICMNGSDLEFKKKFVELEKRKNEEKLKGECHE